MQTSVTVPIAGKKASAGDREKRTKRQTTNEVAAAPATGTNNSRNHRSRTTRQKLPTPTQNSKSLGLPVPMIVPIKTPSPSAPSPSPFVPPVTGLASSAPQPSIVPAKVPVKVAPGVVPGAVPLKKEEAKLGRTNRQTKKEPAPVTERLAVRTVRRKKNSNTNTNTSSQEGVQKLSSENDKKKSSPHTSSESLKRKSGEQVKSQGSKEPSDKDEKGFRQDLAQKFFKQLQENRQKARERAEDSRLEKMPESSQLNISTRALRKKQGKKTVKQPLDSTIFKPNGEPVWVFPEVPLEKRTRNEEGVSVPNPELVAALAEDDLDADEFNWGDIATECIGENLPSGKMPAATFEPDPYLPMEDLEANNVYFSMESIKYNTARVIVDMSRSRILDTGKGDEGRRRRPIVTAASTTSVATALPMPPTEAISTPPTTTTTPPPVLEAPSTTATTSSSDPPPPHLPAPAPAPTLPSAELVKPCVETAPQVRFLAKSTLLVSYDRLHPLASMRKFNKKMSQSREQTTQIESKEKT